ncbi:DUF4884 domain-containing protein [Paraflavitalea sp. CAU 1676]|uniref:DUF4884 domain-containing protein n=1 Tax=Paraflavitalea sp. CAU 1676 TaxID=3032598 RepID=UPI0023DC2227|nr:DUF4884 domain-containing protein [Paraflavitalea sp. CAU 1676]MDF2192954.1 DUF4884 domain-containing protein [Paraflavitalea sp. CAU 1676]
MRQLILILCVLSFFSCRSIHEPLYSKPSHNNRTYTVQYLFEHDGCKVYRFYDQGNYVYFTNCNGQAIARTDSTTTTNTTRLAKDLPVRIDQQVAGQQKHP